LTWHGKIFLAISFSKTSHHIRLDKGPLNECKCHYLNEKPINHY